MDRYEPRDVAQSRNEWHRQQEDRGHAGEVNGDQIDVAEVRKPGSWYQRV